MSRTPADVDDALFRELGGHLGGQADRRTGGIDRSGELPRPIQSRVCHSSGRILGRCVLRTTGPRKIVNVDLTAEFETHRSRLFGLAYRMGANASEAEDIVQEAYLPVERAGGQARSPGADL